MMSQSSLLRLLLLDIQKKNQDEPVQMVRTAQKSDRQKNVSPTLQRTCQQFSEALKKASSDAIIMYIRCTKNCNTNSTETQIS